MVVACYILLITFSLHRLELVSAYNDPSVNGSWKFFIPDGYKRADAPQRDDAAAAVYVKLQINNVEDINENDKSFVIHCVILDIWNDFRLKVDTAPYEFPYKFTTDGTTKIWKPDLTFDNSKSGSMFPISVPNTVILLQGDGSVYRLTRYELTVGCFMELYHFPMDTQRCEFVINLFSTTNKHAILHWVDEDGSPYKTEFAPSIEVTAKIEPYQFYFETPKPHKRIVKRLFGEHTYLVANFTFVRRLTGNIVNTYVPSGLVVILSWVSFWIDVNAVPGRVTLGVTSILTLCTTIVQTRSNVMVNYLRAMDIWLLACLVIVFASLIEYALCYHQSQIRRHQAKKSKLQHQRTYENARLNHESSKPTKLAWINNTKRLASVPTSTNETAKLALKIRKYGPDAEPTARLVTELSTAAASYGTDVDNQELLSPNTNKVKGSGPQEVRPITEDDVYVEKLDRYSRIAFPLVSICFTTGYWLYYYLVAFE